MNLFAKAGADWIGFHPEASAHMDRSLTLIRSLVAKAGLVLNPATPIGCLDWVMDRLDLILLMSVNPGFGGQAFIPSTLDKLGQYVPSGRFARRAHDQTGNRRRHQNQ